MLTHKLIALVAVAGLMPAAAAAQNSKPQSQDVGKSARMICKTIMETGSRLAKKRICTTAADWEDIRRQQQMTTERIQNTQPRPGGG